MGLLCNIDEKEQDAVHVDSVNVRRSYGTHSPYVSPHLVHTQVVHSPVVTTSHVQPVTHLRRSGGLVY